MEKQREIQFGKRCINWLLKCPKSGVKCESGVCCQDWNMLWISPSIAMRSARYQTLLDPGIPVPKKRIQREEMGEGKRHPATLTPEKFHQQGQKMVFLCIKQS